MTSAKSPAIRLQHMLEHIDGILSATDGLSSREILDCYVVIRAVERSLQIVSEAAKELPLDLVALEPDIPWRSIVGIGNLLRHEYYRIRDDDILDILHHHLPNLRPAVIRLIARSKDA